MSIRHLSGAVTLAALLLAGCCHHRPAPCCATPPPPQPYCPPAGVPAVAVPPGAPAGAIVNPMPNPNFGR
jgi:hypothetical protein